MPRHPPSAWMATVKRVAKANPGMKLKQVLKMAKKEYRKKSHGGADGDGTASPSEMARGGRSRRHRGGNGPMPAAATAKAPMPPAAAGGKLHGGRRRHRTRRH